MHTEVFMRSLFKLLNSDIAIALHQGTLFSKRPKDPHVEVSEVGRDRYFRGTLADRQECINLIKLHFRKHFGKLQLIPPRVLFTGFHRTSHLIREIFVESGARESVFLERPMAVAIGHDAAEEVPAKRTYLLLDQDTIQILGVDGINPAVNYTYEMGIDYLYDSTRKESTPLGTGDFAPFAAQKILAFFSDLKMRGYIEKEVYIWGSDEKNIVDRILGESNLHWRKIKLEYAINGASIVIDDLAPRLRLKRKQASRT